MIIICPNCNKQFKIDNSLIPDEGRDLQCGSCNHVWFHNIENDDTEILELRDEVISNETNTKIVEKKEDEILKTNQQLEISKTKIKQEINEKIQEKSKSKTTSKNTENKGSKFLSYIIVFIISFIGLIILLDTLKTPLINVIPGLEIILFNLFETLKDIKLFIIDLT